LTHLTCRTFITCI